MESYVGSHRRRGQERKKRGAPLYPDLGLGNDIFACNFRQFSQTKTMARNVSVQNFHPLSHLFPSIPYTATLATIFMSHSLSQRSTMYLSFQLQLNIRKSPQYISFFLYGGKVRSLGLHAIFGQQKTAPREIHRKCYRRKKRHWLTLHSCFFWLSFHADEIFSYRSLWHDVENAYLHNFMVGHKDKKHSVFIKTIANFNHKHGVMDVI